VHSKRKNQGTDEERWKKLWVYKESAVRGICMRKKISKKEKSK